MLVVLMPGKFSDRLIMGIFCLFLNKAFALTTFIISMAFFTAAYGDFGLIFLCLQSIFVSSVYISLDGGDDR